MADYVYLKKLDTGRVMALPATDAALKEKAGTHAVISREEFRAAKDAEAESYSIGATTRLLHIRVPESVHRSFRERCVAESIGVEEAIAELVLQYSKGAMLVHVSRPKKARSNGADYLTDHGKERG
jgi:hypothetical protein